MIGTVICRNCDTAIEVSEGDVARFRTNPVFACSVCQHDLTQRVAEMLGRSPVVLGTVHESPSLSDPDEFTVPDDEEAFDGLPMGESFDDAALRLKAVRSPAQTPVMRTPQATPVMEDPAPEDPSALALRIAGQAQAQALALAEKALASVAPHGAPDGAATEPGIPPPLASPSTEVGVVPEEPENETTARRADHAEGSVAEPTLPSDGGDEGDSADEHTAGSVPEERTPLMSAHDDERSIDITRTPEMSVPAHHPAGVLPSAPTNEATPSVSRGGTPVIVEDEPPREVTAKRNTPPSPPPRIMRTTVPRTGTGPAGIGALGIRVVANRAVVRPVANGKAAVLPAPNAETQVSAIELDRPSAGGRAAAAASGSFTPTPQPSFAPPGPFSSPRGGTPQRSRSSSGAPMWAMIGGGGLVLAIVAIFGLRANGYLGASATPTITPMGTWTPEVVATETAVTVVATPTEARTPPVETPAAPATQTARATPTATPESAPVLGAFTPVTRVSSTPGARIETPTPTIVASAMTPTPRPVPTAKPGHTLAIEAARAKAATGNYDGAMRDLYGAGLQDPPHQEELWDAAWMIGARRDGSKDVKLSLARAYVPKFPNGKSAPLMKIYIERFEAKAAGATPTTPP